MGEAVSALKPSEQARLAEVRRIGTERVGEICHTLSEAFAGDPFTRWVFGGEADPSALLRWWEFLVIHAPPGSEFHVSGDLAGVAVWHPPGVGPVEVGSSLRFRKLIESLLGGRAGEALFVFSRLTRRKPVEAHWHLAVLGVLPHRQNSGLGSKLLVPMLARCDSTGTPAYLESSNPRNLGFYERAGFRTVGSFRYSIDSPPLSLMWRDPSPAQ